MPTDINLHSIQADILTRLLFAKELRFSEIFKGYDFGSDLFNFHLKRLVSDGLIEKNEKGKYQLTPKGKEFANRMDTQIKKVERQPKVGILVVCVRKKNGERQYLTQQRLKQPYFGFLGFITGKIRWGEEATETAERELFEETGLSGNLKFVGIEHKTDYSKKGDLLEDKFFFVFKATALTGKFINSFQGGKNVWMTEAEIRKTKLRFLDIDLLINMAKATKLSFVERKYSEASY